MLAQKLGLVLVSPADDLLLQLSQTAVKRSMRGIELGAVESIAYPAFVKSYIPQLIPARVYSSTRDLLDELRGLEATTALLVSEVVELVAEVRCWLLAGEVLSSACYEGDADIAAAGTFARTVAAESALPSPCVLDVGLTRDRGWVVIEANAAWGAGLNGCDALAAARCIAQATTVDSPP